MFEKPNKLRRASRYFFGGGGGGGSSNISGPYGMGGGNRDFNHEIPTINQGYGNQFDQFNQFGANNPLLNAANTGASDFFKNLPSLTGPLQSLEQQTPGFFSGLQNELGGFQNQVGGLLKNLPNAGLLTDPLRKTFTDYGNNIKNVFNPVVASGGALTGNQLRDATQQARALGPSGSLQNPSAIASEVLNRDTAKDHRLELYSGLENQAAGAQGGLAGQIQSLIGSDTGLRSALLGQEAGLTGQKGNLFGQQVSNTTGLSQGQQALQTGGLNQLLGTLGGGVSAFGGLTNPILGYIGNLFSGNQQTQIAQAQINAQQNQANSAKGAGAASGIGSVISTVLPIALAAFSDERTKTKIADSGLKTPEGVPISTWEYKTNPGVRFLGATAQDIEKKMPSAVFTDPRSGLKMIDTTQFPIVQISATKPTSKAA